MSNKNDDILVSRRDFQRGIASFAALASLVPSPLMAAADSMEKENEIGQRADAICQSINNAVRLALVRSTATYPLAQASAVAHVLQNLQLGLAMNYVNADPARPTLFNYMGPHVKQGGDNSDAFYSGFAVDHRNTYRLSGKIGSAAYVSITTVERDDSTPWGGRMGAGLYGHQMHVNPNGTFEVLISSTEQKGNWLKISEKDFRVTIRQFFSDWESEKPMEAIVEVVNGSRVTPIPYTAERVMTSMEATAQWLNTTIRYWQDVMDMFRKTPNQFQGWRELTGDKVNATPGGAVENCYWNIPDGKALVMRVRPPQCRFWNVEFNNPWWETMDYRFRLSGTNNHYAVLEDDGELILVAAHEDPGVPNWLDTCGHLEGMMGRRWMFADENPKFEMQLVDHKDLFAALPPTVKRISADTRQNQIAAKQRALYTRFHTL
ncbi:MAG: DUF1214 domain-containing protein [Pseudomonadales bacterium]|jgi:hypothetical protein|nr:DUF1214 domain-containing protein [Pseudomonadales bacterium]MCP5336853.1 DUF1214 domain-containing protein [Pseudomonadales bacterium]